MRPVLSLLIALLIIPISVQYAQPKVTINLTWGYDLPLPDLKGDIENAQDRQNTFVMNNGYNGGLTVKFSPTKKGNLRLNLTGKYNGFESSDFDSNSFIKKSNMKIIAIGLGAEYAFMPKEKANPFLGIDLTGNFFSGESEGILSGQSFTRDLKSATRFGLGIGGGLDFAFNKQVGAVVGVKYHLANLIGKDNDTTGITNTSEYPLVDKEVTIAGVTIPSKNISYFEFYIGIGFYFGQPAKKVKK
jgi:opacity protein-like surface antigen